MTNARWCLLAIAVTLVTVRAERIYFVGNSLTDQIINYPFASASAALGETVTWASDVCLGSPLGWHYENSGCGALKGNLAGGSGDAGHFQSAMNTHTWDIISMQPFGWACDVGDMREAPVVEWVARQAMARNPDVQVYVYAQWPDSGGRNFANRWLAPYVTPEQWWANGSKQYYECVLQRARERIGSSRKPVLMIPVGHVMYELNRRIVSGSGVPGLRSIMDLYEDDIHLTDMGAYLCCVTFFATMFKHNPAGFPTAGFSGVTAQFAAAVQDAVWSVVTSEPLTGVSATAVTSAARAAAVRRTTMDGAAYSLTGRLIGMPRSVGPARAGCVLATEGSLLRPLFVDRN